MSVVEESRVRRCHSMAIVFTVLFLVIPRSLLFAIRFNRGKGETSLLSQTFDFRASTLRLYVVYFPRKRPFHELIMILPFWKERGDRGGEEVVETYSSLLFVYFFFFPSNIIHTYAQESSTLTCYCLRGKHEARSMPVIADKCASRRRFTYIYRRILYA